MKNALLAVLFIGVVFNTFVNVMRFRAAFKNLKNSDCGCHEKDQVIETTKQVVAKQVVINEVSETENQDND